MVGQVLDYAVSNARVGAEVRFEVLERALANARVAVAALQREQPPPPAWFPSSQELAGLLRRTPHGTDVTRLLQWFNDHPQSLERG